MTLQPAPRPVVLNQAARKKVLERFDPDGQAFRIVELLSSKTHVATGELCAKSAANNVSCVVRVACNPRLEPLGFKVACEKPVVPIPNKYGHDSGQFLWSIYRLNKGNP